MIKVITDTTSSMTKEQYEKSGIIAIPLYVCENDTAKKELFEMPYAEFYQKIRSGTKFTTSQPDPKTITDIFKEVVEQDDEAIFITLSSKISGTFNCAELVTDMIETDKISVFDSRNSGFCQASLALKAVEMAQAGFKRSEIIETMNKMRANERTYFMVETLRYLYEGGRLNGAQALFGSIIQLKPIVSFEDDGIMGTYDKIRTLKAARARLVELITERAALGPVEKAGLHYGDNIDSATAFAKEMEEILHVPVELVQVSPVISVHTGPDLLGPSIITKHQ